jgi:hypothetical protein
MGPSTSCWLWRARALREGASLLLGAGLWPGEGQVALCNGLGAASAAYGLAIYYGRDRRMERRVQAFHVAVAAGFFLAGGGNRGGPSQESTTRSLARMPLTRIAPPFGPPRSRDALCCLRGQPRAGAVRRLAS